MATKPRITIVGGGWAGLAAAVELADHGLPVTLLEAAKQLGGRARRIPFGNLAVDNGQHLLIGAYSETLRLLRVMGLPEYEVVRRTPLALQLRAGADQVALRAPNLRAPFHLAWALLRARGFSFAERRAALRLALHLSLQRFHLEQDTTVAALLAAHRQPPRVVERLWAPLCLATLNLPVEAASAVVFLRVLRDAFARSTRDSDLLFPRTDLNRLFPEPARNFVQRRGGTIQLGARVTGLNISHGRITGMQTADGALSASHVILALPAHAAGELLAACEETRPLSETLCALTHTPITTVYLRYPAHIKLDIPMVGMVGTLTQWVFDRGCCGQEGLMAAVVSGEGDHDTWERSRIAEQVAAELASHFGWPAPEESFVVRERRATFRCDTGVECSRPTHATPVAGLWLAGDYTATGYPATLEGAVRSGVECARLILADLGRTRRGLT